MDRPCVKSIKCGGPIPGLEADSPVTNYSSELSDGPDFTAYVFPTGDPYDPGRPAWWAAEACAGVYRCVSYVSQEDANRCAKLLADTCAATKPPTQTDPCLVNPQSCVDPPVVPGVPPTTPNNPLLFYNTAQTSSFVCPDGNASSYTVPARSVVADSQSKADALALAQAQQLAIAHRVCIGPIMNQPCQNYPYSETISISGVDFPFIVTLTGGLPPGITFDQVDFTSFRFSGTAPIPGDYSPSITVVSSNGTSVSKVFDMRVLGIQGSTALTAGFGSPYSYQFVGVGGSGIAPVYTFAKTDGDLPDGLDLDPSGLISGTATSGGIYNFQLRIEDGSGRKCFQNITIELVCAIQTLSLPSGEVAKLYDEKLSAGVATPQDIWSVTAGALPAGLSLDSSTGEITGVPTAVAVSVFTIQFQNGLMTCEKAFTINVNPATGPDWSQLNWTPAATFNPAGVGTWNASASPSPGISMQNTGYVEVIGGLVGGQSVTQTCNAAIVPLYTGPLVNCEFRLKTTHAGTFSGAPASANIRISLFDSVPQDYFYYHNGGPVDVVIPFTIPASVAKLINIRLDGTNACEKLKNFTITWDFMIYNV